jgi:hypothetical protein
VALLIDYDNLQLGAQRDAPGSGLDLRSIVALAQRYGTLLIARAYAEWNNPTERLEAYKAGIEPVFAPVLRTPGASGAEGKSLADPVMVADGVDLMWTHSPDVFVLVTSDKDMIPLVRVAKQRGAKAVVVGSDFTAVLLREIADEVFSYRQVVQEVTGVLVGPQGTARSRGREPRQASHARERAAAAAPPPPPPLPAPATERQAAAEPAPAASEAGADERQSQSAARRRRRRGGRGRGRSGALGPGEATGEPVLTGEPVQPSEPLLPAEPSLPNGVEPFEPVPFVGRESTAPTFEPQGAPLPSEGEPEATPSDDQAATEGGAATPSVRRRRRTPRAGT